MDKYGSVVDRMQMKLGSKFSRSLRVKTQFLKRLQYVIVVDGATHTQKDGAKAFVLFLHGARTCVCVCVCLCLFMCVCVPVRL